MNNKFKTGMYLGGLVLLIILIVSLCFRTFMQIDEAAEARMETAILLKHADALLSTVAEAEASVRGYLLTGEDTYLQPYLAVHDSVSDKMKVLRRRTLNPASLTHLDRLQPLLDSKMARMARIILLRKSGNTNAVTVAMSGGQGMQLMDLIRAELGSFTQREEGELLQSEAHYRTSKRNMFVMIAVASAALLLLSLAFGSALYKKLELRHKEAVLRETERQLKIQEDSNRQLQQANDELEVSQTEAQKLLNQIELYQTELEGQNVDLKRSQHELETQQIELEQQNEDLRLSYEAAEQLEIILRDSEERLSVTLNSIGDGVISIDIDGHVMRLNPVAEKLTGWTQGEAFGSPLDIIFTIVTKETRQPIPVPTTAALADGTFKGLAKHTILISRDGSEYDIADSCAPIRDYTNQVIGAVMVFRNVTEEYVVQQTLSDGAALMRAILNTVVDGIITIHAQGGIVETVNPAAEMMFGYSTEELDGQRFSMLIPELDQDQRNGSLEYYSASEEALASGHGREVMGKRKDGSSFPLELAASEMWLGGQRYFTGILRDISARKAAEEALVKAGALQSAIFNSTNFSSIATDAKGVIQIFNVGAERMFGYTAAEVMNRVTPDEISDPQEVIARARELSLELKTPIAPGFEALAFKASRNIEDIYELTYIRKDGSRFPAVVSVTALRDVHNAIIGYLLIGTDNTARKLVEAERVRLEQVLQDQNIELERATLVAEKANLAKSDFLSSMSHELRTPLSAILGFAQLVESGTPQPTPNQKRSIDQILKAGWYLLELINEILDLALIESGKLSMSLEPVSLNEVMHECETMIEPEAKKHNISVSFADFTAPYFIEADRTRLKQVLINLLSNAIKYNRADGTVRVESVVNGTDSVRISVRDTGAGLSPHQLTQLFQPFNRLGQESSGAQGTGIGLVVSKRLVELMGGVIGVESTVGVGSVFWIEMNLMAKPQAPTYPATILTAAIELKDADEPARTLLYVEDNPANMMLVEDIIARRPDIRLLTARNGKSGIELARTSLPDVILMDINLPGISGIDAMKILAVDHTTAHIPVVALSANAMPRDIERGLEAGFFRYLTKPINVEKFLDTLDVALNYAHTKERK